MKTDKDIIIDGLMARIRELEAQVDDRNYTLSAIGDFIGNCDNNKLSNAQTAELVRNFDSYAQDLTVSGVFDYLETKPDDFIEIVDYMFNR